MIKKPPVFSIDRLKAFLWEYCHEFFSTASLGIIFDCPIVKSVLSNRKGSQKVKENAPIDIPVLPAS